MLINEEVMNLRGSGADVEGVGKGKERWKLVKTVYCFTRKPEFDLVNPYQQGQNHL